MTARVLGRGLSRTLHVGLGLAAPILLLALLYAPFSDWGPFADPSPLGGCPVAVFGQAALGDVAVSVVAWAAGLLVPSGAVGFLVGAMIRAQEPCLNQRAVRGLWRVCLLAVTVGWSMALCLGLAPC